LLNTELCISLKKYIVLYCLFSLAQGLFAQHTDEALVCAEKRNLQELLRFRANPNVYHGYNIHYNRCFWRINPRRNGYLRGNVTAVFTITGTTDSIGFDLRSNMLVDSVLYRGVRARYFRDGDVLYVRKPGKWQAGSYDSVSIYYQGNPQAGSGFGYYVWDNHQTGSVIHTLSQPYGAAFWWPCKQTLHDKIDSIDIMVSTVPEHRVASNGLLMRNDSINDSTRIVFWKHRYPIPTYLVAIASSNYKEFTEYAHFHDRNDSLPIINYVFPQTLAEAQRDVPLIKPIMRLFDSLFGVYPFASEKYGHAQFTWGGGMEHQTMSFMVNFSYDLMAHELAHQWFGDKVTCGSWQDLWLNEGFATYSTALCYRYLRTQWWTERMAYLRDAGTNQEDGSVFVSDTATVNRMFSGNLTYNKAAFVLHMLRIKIGDKAFFDGLKKYLQQGAYGFAYTQDLKSILEAESGQDLTVFFNQWYYGEGYPKLQINWEQKGSKLTVTIDQKPTHSSVPFYALRIPIRFQNSNTDTLLYFSPTQLKQTFDLYLPFAADTAVFDPEVTVLTRASLGGMNLDKVNAGAFDIVPNPARNELVIRPYFNLVQKVEVYNAAGQLVYRTADNFVPALNTEIKIDATTWGNGTYVTRVYSNNVVTSLRFIKL
jgi:aminopeptidase N